MTGREEALNVKVHGAANVISIYVEKEFSIEMPVKCNPVE